MPTLLKWIGSGGVSCSRYAQSFKEKTVKIVSEFWPTRLKKSGVEPENYLKLPINLGFTPHEINEREKKIKPFNISKLLLTNETNLLFTRKKRFLGLNHSTLILKT